MPIMETKMKYLLILLTLTFSVNAYAGFWDFLKRKPKTNQTTIQQTVNGQALTVVLTGEEFVKVENVRSIEQTRTTCYENMAAPTPEGMDSHAQVAREFRLMAQEVNCGSGYADALIAVEARKSSQTKARWGVFKAIGTAAITGTVVDRLGGSIIDGGVKLGAAALSGAGSNTTINASDGSTITGALGEGNTYATTEQVSGILTNPANVDDISLGADPVVPVTDEATCLAAGGDPVIVDGVYIRCSDGSGGSL